MMKIHVGRVATKEMESTFAHVQLLQDLKQEDISGVKFCVAMLLCAS